MAMPRLDFDPTWAGPADWAAMYRAHGLQIVPAHLPAPKPAQWKRPAIKEWREFQKTVVPEPRFKQWYDKGGMFFRHPNMGMLTGSCSRNVFVIDLDTYKNTGAEGWWQQQLALHSTDAALHYWQARTGGGGRHLFFRAPEGWVVPNNNTAIGVDIKGQGGFIMLPPSMHDSGNPYTWEPGRSPDEMGELEEAPHWLLYAIDDLASIHGGHIPELRGEEGERVVTPTPDASIDAWGRQVDGREKEMTGMVWHGLLELARAGGALDTPLEEQFAEATLERYYNTVRTRREDAPDNITGLEWESRGRTLFKAKWAHARRKWNTPQFQTEVARPNPKAQAQPSQEASPSPPSGAFSFLDLMERDVPEEPAYIEPDLLSQAGFMVIGGPPKAQKTFLLQEIQIACAIGRSFMAESFTVPRPLRVFCLQAEMTEKLLRRRARVYRGQYTEAERALLDQNLIVSDRFKMVLDDNGVMQAVALIKSCYPNPEMPPEILSFDPLANLYDQVSENDSAQMMRFLMTRIDAIRKQINPLAGIILIHHATKVAPDVMRRDPFSCLRGGGALRSYYDTGIVMFRKDAESTERELHFEMRGGESPEPLMLTFKDGRFEKTESVFFGIQKKGWPDAETQNAILAAIQSAWNMGQPWSSFARAKTSGRYAPKIINRDWPGVSITVATEIINSWLMPDGVLVIAERNSNKSLMGLCQRRYAPDRAETHAETLR